MHIAVRALRFIGWVELIAAAALLTMIVVVILAQVVLRYGWNSPIRWVEEVCVAAMIWLTFMAASLIYKERRHMALWSPQAHGRLGTALGLAIDVLILATSVYIVWIAVPIVGIENRSVTTSLPFDLPKGWVFSVPVIAGFASICISAAYFIVEGAQRLARNNATPSSLSPLPPLPDAEI